MTLAEAFALLVEHVGRLAKAHAALKNQNAEEHALMATKADVAAALTQMETVLRATVATIGTVVADIAAKVGPATDMTEEVTRINAATQTLTQLAEAVQALEQTGTVALPKQENR